MISHEDRAGTEEEKSEYWTSHGDSDQTRHDIIFREESFENSRQSTGEVKEISLYSTMTRGHPIAEEEARANRNGDVKNRKRS